VPLQIPDVLDESLVAEFRRALTESEWIDGAATAGHLSQPVKHNRQLPETHPLAIELGNRILDRIERHPLFMSYAVPAKIVPPLFNAYRSGEHYGRHIDGAVRPIPGHSIRIRSDISATLFLTDPEDYVGGELIIEDAAGGEPRTYKLAAGTLLLYPSGSVHRVAPVTSGERLASFFWIQSMVRSSVRRVVLFDLDRIIQTLHMRLPGDPCLVDLTGHYHNLLRLWADI
jgi:PKHD-type hydroxylase